MMLLFFWEGGGGWGFWGDGLFLGCFSFFLFFFFWSERGGGFFGGCGGEGWFVRWGAVCSGGGSVGSCVGFVQSLRVWVGGVDAPFQPSSLIPFRLFVLKEDGDVSPLLWS